MNPLIGLPHMRGGVSNCDACEHCRYLSSQHAWGVSLVMVYDVAVGESSPHVWGDSTKLVNRCYRYLGLVWQTQFNIFFM
ncbi:Uncharacterised protein [Klebsiella pneumoniae]|nr:Uncharacterised protein [Klebsiella pneumoniae]SYE96418.1 Uncharacterised protein [Klebsiella pneumoniae]SYK50015.1 Uncharacterised protein [Klebsiella pneumoniae]VAS97520.1 Uncharacterised protein [Klebsiella pneumoniae]HBU2233559.1 hypothetical protein [Klebsiella pneumoniae]